MTTILTVLIAIMTVDETIDIIPDNVSPYVLAAIAVLTAILGKLAHDKSTALADPKASTGVPLAPVDGSRDPVAVNPATTTPPPVP